MLVQTLLLQPTIEALDHCVISRLARATQVHFNTALISPFVHHLANELAAVVAFDDFGLTSRLNDGLQHLGDIFALEALSDMNCQAFSAVAVNHREHAKFAPIKQVVSHEIHASDVIDGLRLRKRLSLLCRFVAFGALVPQS